MKNENIVVINGIEKIILSAPHSVLHMRENSIRPRETKTGVIVKYLAKRCNTYCIYKRYNEYNDVNWDKKCEYKNRLKEIICNDNIKALIDIHGMASHRKQDICIGINGGNNIKGYGFLTDSFINIFNKYGFKNTTIDVPFAAQYENCVSAFISRQCDIPAFQIEINLKYRSSKFPEYKKYNSLLNALTEIINILNKSVK